MRVFCDKNLANKGKNLGVEKNEIESERERQTKFARKKKVKKRSNRVRIKKNNHQDE